MALRKTVPQLQLDELSGEEDAALVQETHQPHTYQYKVPAGIRNLHQWGLETFQSGKHKGKTFAETYEKDSGYAQFILHNTRLTSVDMLSFQNYVKATKKKLSQEMLQGPIMPKTQAHRHSAMSSGRLPNKVPPGPATGSEAEWIPIDPLSLSSPEKPTSETHKRGYSQTMVPTQMVIEENSEKVNELQTQIAILQRELAKQKAPQSNDPQTP